MRIVFSVDNISPSSVEICKWTCYNKPKVNSSWQYNVSHSLSHWITWAVSQYNHRIYGYGWYNEEGTGPPHVTDGELGVAKLRHAPSTSLESFRVLQTYKRIAVVVRGSMYVGVESTHSFNACERLRFCRVYNDDDRKTLVLYGV